MSNDNTVWQPVINGDGIGESADFDLMQIRGGKRITFVTGSERFDWTLDDNYALCQRVPAPPLSPLWDDERINSWLVLAKIVECDGFDTMYYATLESAAELAKTIRDDYEAERRPPPAPEPLSQPDEVDCDYWFDGVGLYHGELINIQTSMYVRVNSIDRKLYASFDGFAFRVDDMRGKWYKRDKAPWTKEADDVR